MIVNGIQLRGEGWRWLKSDRLCDECGQRMIEDHWPPNYGGGSSDGFESKYSYMVKFVCTNCKLHYSGGIYEERRDFKLIKREEKINAPVPLVEMNGVWLTPHDVKREKYKEEHGEYPVEVYA